MKRLKNLIPKTQPKRKTDTSETQSVQNKSPEEIFQEKKRQLKFEQANLDNEKRMYEQDTRMAALQEDLEQIETLIQTAHTKNKKRWLKILLFWGIIVIAMGALLYYRRSSHQKELETYHQQLETDFKEYHNEMESQKQDLQQEIEDLTQELNSLKSSSNET